METRKSARLRAKGRRQWAEDESEEGEHENSSTAIDETMNLSMEAPPNKRARMEGLDEEADDDGAIEESDGLDDPESNESNQVHHHRGKSAAAAAAALDSGADFTEDDKDHETETIRDYPLDIEADSDGKFFIIDGNVYRKLPTERKCGLGGWYALCNEEKECTARATVVRREEDGKLLAKLSKTANVHSHDRPSKGGLFNSDQSSPETPSASIKKRASTSANQRQQQQLNALPTRRRGRPPRAMPGDDDNETDFGDDDDGARYRLPVEIYGMQKYFVMDGYVYRRHRDRLVEPGGMYLRCYQDKELNCPARAVAIWFKKRAQAESETHERFLFGRLSTAFPNHTHSKPQKGHFWVKPGQNTILVPPKLRRSTAGGGGEDSNAEFIDFIEPAGGEFAGSAYEQDVSKRISAAAAGRPVNDRRYTPAESPQRLAESRGQQRKQTSTFASASKRPITLPVQAEKNGAYFIIDGFAFKRLRPNAQQLMCTEWKREANCLAQAMLLSSHPPPKSNRPTELKARFATADDSQHSHARPPNGQYVVPVSSIAATAAAPAPSIRIPSTTTGRALPATRGLAVFNRTPFVRTLSVRPPDENKSEPKSVNLKSIMSSYQYCLNSLIRLQDGYYVGRFPALGKLIDASGSELIEYFVQRLQTRLPMVAADERTAYLLNNDMKHYRAICDFMVLAPNDCDRVMEAYRRWLTPARARAWFNNGDLLEYICRLFLRSPDYSEAYLAGVSLSQRSTRLRHQFRPLLPMPEPKFVRCEKESIRRWEMRQSLEVINSRITSIRTRHGDSDPAITRLFDEFEGVVASFMKFFNRYGMTETKARIDRDVESDEDYEKTLEGSRVSAAVGRTPAPMAEDSDFDDEEQLTGDAELTGGRGKSYDRAAKRALPKFLKALRMHSKQDASGESDLSADDYQSDDDVSSGPNSPPTQTRRQSQTNKRGRGGRGRGRGRGRASAVRRPTRSASKSPQQNIILDESLETSGMEDVTTGTSTRSKRGGAPSTASARGRRGRGRINPGQVGTRTSTEHIAHREAEIVEERVQEPTDVGNSIQDIRGIHDDTDIARELDALEAFASETPGIAEAPISPEKRSGRH